MKTKKGNGHRKRNLFFFVNFWICRLQQLVTVLSVDHWCEIAGPNFSVEEIKKKILILRSIFFQLILFSVKFTVVSAMVRVFVS